MKDETPEQKWKRVQAQVQDGVLNAYPNPDRRGCPDGAGILALATRSAQFDDTIEDDPQWKHVTHCSPCYAQYLETFKIVRLRKPATSAE
jgi:hypothetical protein